MLCIGKNVCESIYDTLLNILRKTKEDLKSRIEFGPLKITNNLSPDFLNKKRCCECLRNIKVPHGYSSNMKNLVSLKKYRLQGLKSHDCHVLIQQLLDVAFQTILSNHVHVAIFRFCFFFNFICATVVDVSKLDEMEKDIVMTLCFLEKCFSLSFFNIVIHLTVHLVHEARLCDPVYMR